LEETSSDSTPSVTEAVNDALADGKLTAEEKEVVVTAILEELKPGEAVSAETLKEAGISYADLPPATPVDVRTDEDGNPVIIEAEVAAALVLLENPAEMLGAIFEDPGQVLTALGSIGADMSEEEREESEKIVVAAVIAGQAAVNAATMAAAATATTTTGGSTGGGSSGGGGASGGSSKGTRGRERW